MDGKRLGKDCFHGYGPTEIFLERGNSFWEFFLMVIGIVIIVITVEERCGVGVVSEGVHHHHRPSFFSSKQNRKTVKMYLLV